MDPWVPPPTKKKTSENFIYGVLGIKIGLKGSLDLISEGIFEKYLKMKILVFDIFEKGQILRPFSGLAPSKLKICSMVKRGKEGDICIPGH